MNHDDTTQVSEIAVESVGIVKVSTIRCVEACREIGPYYWETAILWPEGWKGEGLSADGELVDIIACDRALDDANETHQHWCDSERLARFAHAIVKLGCPLEAWHSAGWFGTWDQRLASEGR